MSALLTTFGIDWHLLALQTANFVVLAVALTWLLYKPVMKMVRERTRVIAQGVTDAEAAARKLQTADHEVATTLHQAEKDADDIVKGARAAGRAQKEALLKEAEARAAQVQKDAEARALEEALGARRESEKEIARLAMLAAEKVVREKV